ncbi:peroxiredoxin [Streptomyces roseolus]|uniref:peroxiredoxin n=1 Tax=Streptomyces roseolus TaxID=67358 RepID=UPI0036628510
MASAPEIGDIVGDFCLPGGHLDGETFHRRNHTLCEQRGRPLVLAFYLGDDTPVRTARLCSHSDGMARFRFAGATVWGISPQGLDSHEKFARNRRLSMPLLSDEERVVAKSFGISAPLIALHRSVFITDGHGRLHWKHVTAPGATCPPAVTLSTRLAGLTG